MFRILILTVLLQSLSVGCGKGEIKIEHPEEIVHSIDDEKEKDKKNLKESEDEDLDETENLVQYKSDEIHKAANRGDLDMVKEILKTSPDVDIRDSFGGTALHTAMFQENIEVVETLIDAGYDVNAQGTSNKYTPLHDAVWANNIDAARLLVESGADLSIENNEGETPFEKAVSEGKTKIAEYLKQATN
ncbi:MAG: ankyrin repeat domain-containing protein [Clostridia bacterium]|jgi:ankyrin repeat protein|nr:ankyrin repeat domain-containing protein [Clostridia bacterium]